MKEKGIITDIFLESSTILKQKNKSLNITNYNYQIKKTNFEINENNITDYVSLFDIKDLMLFDEKIKNYLTMLLKNEIKKFIKLKNIKLQSVLVVGFGNKNYMADCLGDKVASKIFATRQLVYSNVLSSKRFNRVSSYSLSVLGQSGIESADVVKKLCEITKPQLVIAVDTFVSSKLSRLGKSLQISTKGFNPGAGVGNTRKLVDNVSLNSQVFTIGVPLLISASTIADKSTKNLNDLVVMDKEIEKYIKFYSVIISNAINLAVNKNVSLKEILQLIY